VLDKDRIEKEKLEIIQKLYRNAFFELERVNPKDVSEKSGTKYITTKEAYGKFVIPYLNREIIVNLNDKNVYWFNSNKKVDLYLSVLTLHYLLRCTLKKIGEGWISYREIPDASFYSKTMQHTLHPLIASFSEKPDNLLLAAQNLSGKKISIGDIGIELKPFPKFPVAFILYKADEEFPATATVLYNESVKNLLSAEEVKVLTIFLINELIKVKI